jgi:DNA gyrase subunit A
LDFADVKGQENVKKASVENTETDDELMKELLERAEADGSEDEEE